VTPDDVTHFLISHCVFPNSVGFEGSDPCMHPCAMKQSPVGELAMDREQSRAAPNHHSCRKFIVANSRQVSHPILEQEPRKARKHPSTSQSRQFCGGLPTTSPHLDTHFLLWMVLRRHCPTPLLVWNDVSLHLTFPLPNWSCSLTSMRRSQLLILGDPRFATLRHSSLLIFWDS